MIKTITLSGWLVPVMSIVVVQHYIVIYKLYHVTCNIFKSKAYFARFDLNFTGQGNICWGNGLAHQRGNHLCLL